jgi:mono/diheme cytochrome c family protein
MNRILALIGVGLLVAPVLGDPVAKEDLALHARAVLRKHCFSCHGVPAGPGDLSVADGAGIEERFLKRGSPDASYLLQLIEDGSMPPGTAPKVPPDDREALRAWVDDQAPAYPKQFDPDYVNDAVVRDAAKLSDADRPTARYLSLAHLAADGAEALQPQRDALAAALKGLSKAAPTLTPVDPGCFTVYRIDLRQLGWDQTPLDEHPDYKPLKPLTVKFNLFDLMLLEYPYGRRHAGAEKFLAAANQVMPVTYVRGDWLADVFAKSSVAREVRQSLGLPDGARGRGRETDLPPLPEIPFRFAEGREPIPPFDGVTQPAVTPDPAPVRLILFEITDLKLKPKTELKIGDQFLISVKTDKNAKVEIVFSDNHGERDLIPLKSIEGNVPQPFHPDGLPAYPVEPGAEGTHTFTAYVSLDPFPSAVVLRDKRYQAWKDKKDSNPFTGGFVDRAIHPDFYRFDGKFDPASLVKKTITITVKR